MGAFDGDVLSFLKEKKGIYAHTWGAGLMFKGVCK